MTNPDESQVPISELVEKLRKANEALAKAKTPTEKQADKLAQLKAVADDLTVEVLQHPDIKKLLKKKPHGASTIAKLITVTGQVDRVWDQEKILELYDEIDADFFPFKITFTEVREQSKELERDYPDFWAEQYEPALTTKAKTSKVKLL